MGQSCACTAALYGVISMNNSAFICVFCSKAGQKTRRWPLTWRPQAGQDPPPAPLLPGVAQCHGVCGEHQQPGGGRSQAWWEHGEGQTDRAGTYRDLACGSFPFLLSRLKNDPSEASRKFRNY